MMTATATAARPATRRPAVDLRAELLDALQTPSERNVRPRLRALGLLVACSRCGGGGRYSYNAVDGDRCYGCGGSGVTEPRLTRAFVDQVRARVAEGGLVAYFEECSRRRAARARFAAVFAEVEAAYPVVHATYSRFRGLDIPAALVVASGTYRIVSRVNDARMRAFAAGLDLRDGRGDVADHLATAEAALAEILAANAEHEAAGLASEPDQLLLRRACLDRHDHAGRPYAVPVGCTFDRVTGLLTFAGVGANVYAFTLDEAVAKYAARGYALRRDEAQVAIAAACEQAPEMTPEQAEKRAKLLALAAEIEETP